MFTILIKNGQIIDGTGAPAFRGDIAITNDKIVAIESAANGGLSSAQAETIIDADNRLVCPGFIDSHSHSDAYLLVEPSSHSKIFQGITTEVVGNCGASAAPIVGEYQMPADWREKKYPGEWHSVAEYRKLLEAAKPAPNVFFLVGHKSIRVGVMGGDHRESTSDELTRMKDLLREALDDGARGLSTGLIYAPGMFASRHELIELAKVLSIKDGIYTSHMRSEGKGLLEAIDEAIDIGENAGVRTEISHLKTAGKSNWPLVDKALSRIRQARDRGLKLAADRYPYTSSFTELDVIFPDWAQEGGAPAMLRRLADNDDRARIKAEVAAARPDDYWSSVTLGSTWHSDYKKYQGMQLVQAAEKLGMTPVDAVLHLIEIGKGKTCAFFSGMSEENMMRILAEPYVMLGTDASLRAPTGPLSTDYPHPRAYGSFPRFLKMALDGLTVPLEEAVRKMTSLPCEHFGIKNRGILQKGGIADIVIIDPKTLRDTSDYSDPHRLAEGVQHTIINGTQTLSNGLLTGQRAGRWL